MAHLLCNLRITFIPSYHTFPAFMSFVWYAWIKCFAHYPLTVSYLIRLLIQACTAVSDYFNCFERNKIPFIGFCLNPVYAICWS